MRKKSVLIVCGVALALLGSAARAENCSTSTRPRQERPADPRGRGTASRGARIQAAGARSAVPAAEPEGQIATRDTDSNSTFNQAVDVDNDPTTPPVIAIVKNSQSTDADFWNYQAQATQTCSAGPVADAEARRRRGGARRGELSRCPAGPHGARLARILRRAGRRRHVVRAEATLQAFTRQLEQADKRFEVGLIAITDVQEARAAQDSATAGVIAAKRALASSQEVLREITGEAYATLAKPAEDMPLDQPQPLNEQAGGPGGRAEPERHRARLGTDVAKRDIEIARSGHLPTVDLFASRTEFDSEATQINNGREGPPTATRCRTPSACR